MRKLQKQLGLFICILVLTVGQRVQGQVNSDSAYVHAQDSTEFQPVRSDTALRILNLNPYFTLHVDSTLQYQFEINKNAEGKKYFWFLRNSPVGLKINKDNGTLSFKAEKSFFLSGKLKYDEEYKVQIGVQNQRYPEERIDTFFTLVFYNTEILPSKVKPSVNSMLFVEEGDTVNFKVLCETGSFPIEHITFLSNIPLKNYTLVKQCDDDFIWPVPFDFIRENEKEKEKTVVLSFIGTNRFQTKDTATVKIIVRDAINYPMALEEYNHVRRNINNYILQLKYTFLQMDKKLKRTRNTRTTFELSAAGTALGGTVFSSLSTPDQKTAGKILPGVGVAMVPVKETVAPNKTAEQNSATTVRNTIKRLEYLLQNNALVGDRDVDIAAKTQKMRDELRSIQTQMVDVPLEVTSEMSEEELNDYFNSPKVNKKYRMKKK